jgi:lipopolysaccharide/colanic/teichoic acid biosynthesis glycosyltransferase
MYRHFFKRVLDIIGAVVALPFVVVVVAIFGPIIYFTDRGPIFYNAPRAGKDFKVFKMLKLRSMRVNAPDLRNADGSTFNSDDDPRVTRIGHFLRKTSLDEFPQFINVLIGDMSFIGPRPVLTTKPYSEYGDALKKRLLVRPGITGYSQAYYRNSISQDEKYHYDCEYVDKLSFWIDVKIILKTIGSVLGHKNIFIEPTMQSKK